jgi:hypothetical protein
LTSIRAGAAPLDLSNGLTSALVDVLSLAASDLAATPWELRLAYWIVQHDQIRTGLGSVGFDVSELGWTTAGFEAEQRFVLGLIDAAFARQGWDRLPFVPDEDRLFAALRRLRELVAQLSPDIVGVASSRAWLPEELPDERCPRHAVFLHELGCVLCNEVPLSDDPSTAPCRTG